MKQRRGWWIAGWVLLVACSGPRGDPGPPGAAGPRGAAGPVGDQGPSGADGLHYARILTVSPGATEEASGKALRDAVAAATPSADAPWLIRLEPGTYALGSTDLDVKAYLTVEGSGRGVTRLKTEATGTAVWLRAGTALRALDIEAPQQAVSGNRILVCWDEPMTLRNIGVHHVAGGKDGIQLGTIECSSGLDAKDVTVTVSAGAGSARALHAGGPVRLERVIVTVTAPQGATAVNLLSGTAQVRELDATAECTSGNARAVVSAATLTVEDAHLVARGSSSVALLANGNTVAQRSTLEADGMAAAIGVNQTVTVRSSRLVGGSPLVTSLSGATARFTQSQLAGGSVTGSCYACFDENFQNTVGVDKCP